MSKLFLKSKFPGISIINNIYYSVNVVNELKKLVKDECQIDMVQVHAIDLGLFIIFVSKISGIDIPIIIMQHGSPIEIGNNTKRAALMRIIRGLMLKHFRPAYYLQLDDGTLDENFLSKLKYYNIKCKILSHAIDTVFYCPAESLASRNEFIILSNHTLSPFKRVDLTIQAFKKFMEKIGDENKKNIVLKIVGSGSMNDELKQMVSNYNLTDNVIFCGEKSIAETRSEIISSDIVVGTSLISNMNRSIQEAMSCEKPVVIFDNNKSSIFIHLQNAMLVNSGDTDDFADKIKLLYENQNLRKQIGKNARNSIIQSRNWNFRLSQELEVYSEILNTI
jgi:glycosyltransferase involved in cell wall biosynthesis